MKVKVIKKFRDKHTRAIHKVGAVITISKDRYEEIKAAGKYVEPVEDADNGLTTASDLQPVAEQDTATVGLAADSADNDTTEPVFEDMTNAELKEYAAEHNIDLNGARNKAAMVEAIRNAEK